MVGETTRHREAFDVYWRLGAERSIERLRAALLQQRGHAPTPRTLYAWSSQFHWQDRILELEREAKRIEDEARVEHLREMNERHTKEALLMQQKGTEWLAAMDVDNATADAAIRAIKEGQLMERLARGEPTERKDVHGEFNINNRLAALSDAELDRLIEHAAASLRGEGAP